MATVQHLEKLINIKRLFSVEEGLESAVACERLSSIIVRTEQLIKQRAFLREERRRLRMSAERVAERQAAFKVMQRVDWLPKTIATHSTPKEKHVRVCVGGLMFEAPVSIWKRDPKSLLAQLCEEDPPVLCDAEGFFSFDRDWWLFRHILAFLRDGWLPSDRSLLALIYREAAFWHLGELQRAIEEEKLHLRPERSDRGRGKENSASSSSSSSSSSSEKDGLKSKGVDEEREREREKMWWRKAPSWLGAVERAVKEEKEEKKKKEKKNDWWTGTEYKGRVFLPLSSSPEKVVTRAGERDAKSSTMGTWYRQGKNGGNRDRDRDDGYSGGDYDRRGGRERGAGTDYGYGYGYDRGGRERERDGGDRLYSSSSSSSSSTYHRDSDYPLPPSPIAEIRASSSSSAYISGGGGGGGERRSMDSGSEGGERVEGLDAISKATEALRRFESAVLGASM